MSLQRYLVVTWLVATWNCCRLGARTVYTIQPCGTTEFTVPLHAKSHTQCARVLSCNLPPALSIAILSPPEWPALRWAAMRAILMFHYCEGQSHKTVSTNHNFWRERRAEAVSNRGPSVYQPTTLPLGQTGSLVESTLFCNFQTVFIVSHRLNFSNDI